MKQPTDEIIWKMAAASFEVYRMAHNRDFILASIALSLQESRDA